MKPTLTIKYIGDNIVNMGKLGVFQKGTQASVPRDTAYRLLLSDDWQLISPKTPVSFLRLRVGQTEEDN